MDQGEASEDLQQKPSYQAQDIPQELEGIEPRAESVEQLREEQYVKCLSTQQQQDNQENSTFSQIQQHSSSRPVQEIQESPKHQNLEQQTPESEETQIQVNHDPKIQQNLEAEIEDSLKPKIHESQERQVQQNEPQYLENQKPQSHESQEQQMEESGPPFLDNYKPQTHESQECQMQQNHEAKTAHSSQIFQSQQITTPVQVLQPHSSTQGSQEKQPTQHEQGSKKHQQPKGKSEQYHQYLEKQMKKRKKKLVGENQQRINYLVQASKALVLSAGPSTAGQSQRAMAAEVGSLASAVGRRCVLRLAPALKRCLCKGCGTTLIYGVNAKVRHRSRRQKHLVVTCLTCRTIKRFINNPRYQLWYEQEEAAL